MQEIEELDEAGSLCATYVQSVQPSARVDIIKPPRTKATWQTVLDIFLPAGYPQSVTEDYLQYQIYDSLQAFSSSIAGLIASRAVLEGVGVGDASASATAAVLLSIVQESMGRVATIVFAHKLGTSLEPECKMYRLLADFLNDAAMVLDCLSPAFPKPIRVIVFSCSSALRALCGVAAGSAKASLSSHFARWGNLGELNAKDSSQETVISLMGMLTGGVIVPYITTPFTTWATLFFLLALHLFLNYTAVRAVNMHSLNRQRTCLLISNLVDKGKVLSPREVSQQERIFIKGNLLRWKGRSLLGECHIGVSLHALLKSMGQDSHSTGSFKDLDGLAELFTLFHDQRYIMWYSITTREVIVVLKHGATPFDQIKAWSHALLLARDLVRRQDKVSKDNTQLVKTITKTLEETIQLFHTNTSAIVAAGWDLSIPHVETKSGSRIRFKAGVV